MRRFRSFRGPRWNRTATARVDLHKIHAQPTSSEYALALIDGWMEDYNTVHLHSRLGYSRPASTFCPNPLRVRFNGSTPLNMLRQLSHKERKTPSSGREKPSSMSDATYLEGTGLCETLSTFTREARGPYRHFEIGLV
jgi:hypothetical protein